MTVIIVGIVYNYMNIKEFTNPCGGLIPIGGGNHAFLPAPLPPGIALSTATAGLLAQASQALGELIGLCRTLPNPRMVTDPFTRREAILSSRIEGTYATEAEVILFEARPTQPPERQDILEVRNYMLALEFGLQQLKTLPICLRLIRDMHAILMRGVRGDDKRPGEFRTVQNFIGNRGDGIEKARFVPPPVREMDSALDAFEKFLHAPGEFHPLIRLAMGHYQFEAIHPFRDGNGRAGRLLLAVSLCEHTGFLIPPLYLSAYFEKNRDAYMNHLLRISQNSEWLSWIHFFLTGVAQVAKDAARRATGLLGLMNEYRKRLHGRRTSALALRLLDQLFVIPYLTIPSAAKFLGVGYPSAKLAVQRLVRAGVAEEITKAKRDRVYMARGILSALSDEPSG